MQIYSLHNTPDSLPTGIEIRSIVDLVQLVIPHFERYPLVSGKKKDFESFAVICRLVHQGEHQTVMGLRKIIDETFQMNPSGKRKFSKEVILTSLQQR